MNSRKLGLVDINWILLAIVAIIATIAIIGSIVLIHHKSHAEDQNLHDASMDFLSMTKFEDIFLDLDLEESPDLDLE